MANPDVIVTLLQQLDGVVEAGYKPLPDYVTSSMPPGSLAFWVHRVLPGDKSKGTWPGRDDHAEVYVPPEVFDDPVNNEAVVAQMTFVLDEIAHDIIPVAEPTPEIVPENPPPEVPETQNEAELSQPATNP